MISGKPLYDIYCLRRLFSAVKYIGRREVDIILFYTCFSVIYGMIYHHFCSCKKAA